MRVQVNEANMKHCRCPECPVQKASKCNATKLTSTDPKDAKSVRLFCALGKTECNDFDGKQYCSCPTCLVWDENNLNSAYYCQDGEAKQYYV